MMKICTTCKQELPICEYARDRRSPDGYSYNCKDCRRVARRKQDLKKKYGITPDDYNMMIDLQNNVCAICGLPETQINNSNKKVNPLAVDHCHKTGEVRGLLCNRCNMILGKVNDDVKLLKSMIDYLEAY